MDAFATLLDRLSVTQSRTGKLALLSEYFTTVPDPDRGYALAALTDGLDLRLSLRRLLLDVVSVRIDPHLYKLSRDYVGDTAETVALLWRAEPGGSAPLLRDVVSIFATCAPGEQRRLLSELLDRLDARGRWALLKLLGGAPRVGVSARLAKTALAAAFAKPVEEIEEVWPVLAPPYRSLFAWLTNEGPRPSGEGLPQFRPMMLAVPLEERDFGEITPDDFVAEWKWDGIRVQVAAASGEVRIFSRTGDDISSAFPEIVRAFEGRDVTLDGELLVMRDGRVAPFNDLQQRLNRKAVSARQMRDHPAHVRAYDLLMSDRRDLRPLPFAERRQFLEAWVRQHPHDCIDVSPLVSFSHLQDLAEVRRTARAAGIEGLMLKRRSSSYLAGRVKGHWYKWKRDALTADCVLMYAQRGSGKRSSFYSDYTFGAWRSGPGGERDLVPVGKAYSGFSDEELARLDRFVRANTVQSFGPVRAVKPELVLEVAFDGVQRSTRHKSGLALRFPRIHRVRWDKPAGEADRVEALEALVDDGAPV
jgi:DNA ligase-1